MNVRKTEYDARMRCPGHVWRKDVKHVRPWMEEMHPPTKRSKKEKVYGSTEGTQQAVGCNRQCTRQRTTRKRGALYTSIARTATREENTKVKGKLRVYFITY